MAKKNASGLKIFIISMFMLVLTFGVSSFGTLYFSLPDSFIIPDTISGASSVSSFPGYDIGNIKNEDLSIHFLELGNKYAGDCVLIKVGDTEVLVDGGSRADSVSAITNYVNNFCTDNVLEYVIVTHAHEDHYAGFATYRYEDSLFAKYYINNIVYFSNTNKTNTGNSMYSRFLNNMAQSKKLGGQPSECDIVTNYVTDEDDSNAIIELSDKVDLEFLYQKYYDIDSTSENEYSVCFQIIHADTSKYLFTGDLETDGEESLINSNPSLGDVVLYKAGHHGSKTSSSRALLEAITPDIIVVTCVAGSPEYTSKKVNQFPTQTFINNVATYADTAQVYITSLCIDYDTAEFGSFNGNIAVCSTLNQDTKVYCSNSTVPLQNSQWLKDNRTVPTNWEIVS